MGIVFCLPPHRRIMQQGTDSANFLPVQVQDTLDNIFIAVDQMPAFPGGISELMKYLQKNIRYPKECTSSGALHEKIVVSFVVTKIGKVKDADVRNGGCKQWKKHIIQVVNAMPAWNAARKSCKCPV